MKQETRDGTDYASVHVLVKPDTARTISLLLDGGRNRDAFIKRAIADYAGALSGMDGAVFVRPSHQPYEPIHIQSGITFIITPEKQTYFDIETIGEALEMKRRIMSYFSNRISDVDETVKKNSVYINEKVYLNTMGLKAIFRYISLHTPIKQRLELCERLYYTLCLCESVIVSDPSDYDIDYVKAITKR